MTAQTLRYSTKQLPPNDGDLQGWPLSVNLQFVRLIGRGGMGEVWEAASGDLPGQRFAVKIIRESYSQDPGVVARFFGEARAAGAIDDPNIIGVHGTGRTGDKRPALVMPFIEGPSLADMCEERGPLPIDIVGKVLLQLASALRAAHGANIIHRDIKPQNVMVMPRRWGRDWFVLLVDFGICKFQDAELAAEIRTKTKQYIGTPGYSAPEQVLGKPVDGKADVYSLGVLAYRILCGRDPFDGDSAMEVMHKQINGTEVVEPKALRPDIPREWNDLILLCLDPTPAHRPTASVFGRWIAAGMQNGATMLTTLAPQIAAETQVLANAATISSDVPTALAQIQALANRRQKKRLQIAPMLLAALTGVGLTTLGFKLASPASRPQAQGAIIAEGNPGAEIPHARTPEGAPGRERSSTAQPENAAVPVSNSTARPTSASGAAWPVAGDVSASPGGKQSPPPSSAEAPSPSGTGVAASSGTSARPLPPVAGGTSTGRQATPSTPAKRMAAQNDADLSKGRSARPSSGQLDIHAKTWADCYLADSDHEVSLGTTPVTTSIAVGQHRVRCENKGLHKDETTTVNVDAAKPAVLEKNW